MTTPNATPKPRAGEHTRGPWHVDNSGYPTIIAGEQVVTRVNGHSDFDKDDRANARRIVACVNYLEGFKTEDLEQRRDNQVFLLEERDSLRERERELVRERDQQERFKWAGNRRIEELAAVLKQVADRLSAWRDGANIAFNASGSEEQYNLRGNYDGLLSAIEAVMVETVTPKHGR